MKKYIITIVINLVTIITLNAQQFSGNNNTIDPLTRTGSVTLKSATTTTTNILSLSNSSISASNLDSRSYGFSYSLTPYSLTMSNSNYMAPYTITSLCSGNIIISNNGSSSAVISAGTSNNTYFEVLNNGTTTLGIPGSTSPLTVNGNITSSGLGTFNSLKVNGNITSTGLGTFNSLNVNGPITSTGLGTFNSLNVNGNLTTGNVQTNGTLTSTGNMILGSGQPNSYLHLKTNNNGYWVIGLGIVNGDNRFGIGDVTKGANRFNIDGNGNVGIGTTNTSTGYLLNVNGGIYCEEVRVVTDVPASDYVFEKDYKLKTLSEVEAFVTKNKHLPEVPSAAEFKRDGYKVGEMDDLLLRKVEELTLYVIELQKQVEVLKTAKQ